MSVFTYQGERFLLDGEPFQVRSGAIHYFRIPRYYWRDRLLKLKECGLNTVETYVAWNLHEKQEGTFDFSGELDFGAFLDIAAELGLKAIVRPGPYICAEWEGGGLPSWLLRYPNLKIRTSETTYWEKASKYLAKVCEILKPRVCGNGGNVIMLQAENEYGSFGNDKAYIRRILDLYQEKGMDCLYFTCDACIKWLMDGTALDDCIITVNFGSSPITHYRTFSNYRHKGQPYMCSEFWCGWFDYWHGQHNTRSAESVAENIEPFLENQWNFNYYMFCGGTNFGFMNGANCNDGVHYTATTTSYDYNAVLSESGDRTERYYSLRNLCIKHGIDVPEMTAQESEKRAYGAVTFTGYADLTSNLANIGTQTHSPTPLTMEECGQNYGYILYSSTLEDGIENGTLHLENLGDRSVIYIDGEKRAVYERGIEYENLVFSTKDSAKLEVLVENTGRINFGMFQFDKKGMTGVSVSVADFGRRNVFGWEITSLPMENLNALAYADIPKTLSNRPAFYKGKFQVDKKADTFLRLDGFGKGFVLINGFNIGRYYTLAGPQKTLYVPINLLKEGENEIVVFDSDGANSLQVEFVDTPSLQGK